MGHARALLTLDCKAQLQIINKIIQKNLSVRTTELLVKQAQFQQKNLLSKIIDRDTLYLQQQLSEKLNAKVEIIHKKNGSGQLTIKYASLEELDGILQQLD
jgi:ParB family chromosome partitioning protein